MAVAKVGLAAPVQAAVHLQAVQAVVQVLLQAVVRVIVRDVGVVKVDGHLFLQLTHVHHHRMAHNRYLP